MRTGAGGGVEYISSLVVEILYSERGWLIAVPGHMLHYRSIFNPPTIFAYFLSLRSADAGLGQQPCIPHLPAALRLQLQKAHPLDNHGSTCPRGGAITHLQLRRVQNRTVCGSGQARGGCYV